MAVRFHKSLEDTLHRALANASQRKHEYATIEHLLLGLIDDEYARRAMVACGVDIDELRSQVVSYLDVELQMLAVEGEVDPSPTSGFQRIVQRAILHMQSSGGEEINGANVLVALFSERESYACYFLQQQDLSRLDVVSYIAHGVGKGEEAVAARAEPPSRAPASRRGARSRRAPAAPAASEAESAPGREFDAPIERLRQLQHDIRPFSDAIAVKPSLATPKIAEKVVEFLSELLIQESGRNPTQAQSSLLAVGIYGPWGSGKSTLLAAISRILEKDGAIVVPINAWRWDGQTDIYAFMNEQLLAGLSQNRAYRWPARALSLVLLVRRHFRKIVLSAAAAGLVLAAIWLVDVEDFRQNPQLAALKSAWAAAGAAVLAILAKPLATLIERLVVRTRAPDEPGEMLSTSYRYLLFAKSMGRSRERPVFFLFDDLDRCEPDRVVQFMRSIHRLTASGSVSIIGCDDRIVAASIYSEFQQVADLSGEGRDFGSRFLEKMVQVHFRMPDVDEADLRTLGFHKEAVSDSSEAGHSGEGRPAPSGSSVPSEYVKDLGQIDPEVDIASLQGICVDVLGAVVELYRLPIRRIKFLTNIIKLYSMIFPPIAEEAAYRLAAFLAIVQVDPQWLVDCYFGGKQVEASAQRNAYYDRLRTYLGPDPDAVRALYGLCGLDDAQCASAPVQADAAAPARASRAERAPAGAAAAKKRSRRPGRKDPAAKALPSG